ncbi:MAG: thiolase family protein [Pseudomonadota bacterium]
MVLKQPAGAYIIAARRTALGRIGGLHAGRRIEDLAAPVISAAIDDAAIESSSIDELIVGNATAGGNPARLIALASGLPETANATTIDQQDASGLVAIIQASRLISQGDAEVVIAGGAESLSTAPWRIARPRNAHQMPRFIHPDPVSDAGLNLPFPLECTEKLARDLNISRSQQDAFAAGSLQKAVDARKAKRFDDEIVPLRSRREEGRDQSTASADIDYFEDEEPYLEDTGTLTPANTCSWHDGAAFVVIVSEERWRSLGRPPALSMLSSASVGVPPGSEAVAPVASVKKLYKRLNGFDRSAIEQLETSETSAVQVIALAEALGIEEAAINPEGGALARGHPFGAAGALLVVRLFSQLARNSKRSTPAYAVATQGALGGLGVAALFGTETGA